MIIKSFSLDDINKTKSNIFLFYGENEGHKEEIIKKKFLDKFKGEIIKYDENQVLENKNEFFETCFNRSLFDREKIIVISRVTSKLYDTALELSKKPIDNIIIIFNSGSLEKRSKIRQLFEKETKLICVAFYQDNNASLFKIASEFFKVNKILISSENINLIIEKCSGDRKNLQNEMNKILNYCFNKKKIDREQILKLINFHGDDNYFELIDHCLSKNHKAVYKIINNRTFDSNDSIILIRSLLSRLKRLIELKELQTELGTAKDTVNNFRPPIFWKEKEVVQKQVEIWSTDKVYDLLDEVNNMEINLKKNSGLSNNIVFDLILNTSSN